MAHPANSRALRAVRALPVGVPAAVLLLYVWWPFLSTRTFMAGYPDWRARANYTAYAVTAIVRYHGLPLWASAPQYHQMWLRNLQHGFFSNPETEVLSPFIPVYAAAGFAAGARISVAVHLAVGIAGLALLLRERGARGAPPLALCAVLLFGSGFLVRHLLVGHLQFVSFTYFPIALWAYFGASQRPPPDRVAWRRWVIGGLVLAAAYYEGNAHLTIDFLCLLALLAAGEALSGRGTSLRPIAAAGGMAGVFALLAAWKLFPGLAEYGGYQAAGATGYTGPAEFISNLIRPMTTPRADIASHELSLYVGVVGAIVLAAGVLAVRKGSAAVAAALAILLACTFTPLAESLARVPGLASQRPTRLGGDVLLLAVVLVADAIARVSGALARRPAPAAARVAFGGLQLMLALTVGFTERRGMSDVLAAAGETELTLPPVSIDGPDAELVDPLRGRVSTGSDGPNGFWVQYEGDASAATPAVIRLPTIPAREGRAILAVDGGDAAGSTGPFAVRVSAPRAHVALRYHSPYLLAGGFCSIFGLAMGAWLLRPERPRAAARTAGG